MSTPAPASRFRVAYSPQWYRTWVIWCTGECVVWAGTEAPEGGPDGRSARAQARALAAILAASSMRDAPPVAVRTYLAGLCGQPLQTGEYRQSTASAVSGAHVC